MPNLTTTSATLFLLLAAGPRPARPPRSSSTQKRQPVVFFFLPSDPGIRSDILAALKAQLSDLPVRLRAEEPPAGPVRQAARKRIRHPRTLLVGWLSMTGPRAVLLWVHGSSGPEARPLELGRGASWAEAVALVVRSQVEALLEMGRGNRVPPGTSGSGRAGARARLRGHRSNTSPKKDSRPTSRTSRVRPPRARWSLVTLEAAYGLGLYTTGPKVRHEAGLTLAVRVWHPIQWVLAVSYLGPVSLTGAPADLELQGGSVSTGLGLDWRLGPFHLGGRVLASLDVVRRSVHLKDPSLHVSEGTDLQWWLETLLRGAYCPWPRLGLELSLGFRTALSAQRYILESQPGQKATLEPWHVQPIFRAGIALVF